MIVRIPTDDTLFELLADYVCDKECQSYEMVTSMARYPELVKTRRVINAVLSGTFSWSQSRIAQQWRQDHTSVGHGLRTMTDTEANVSGELGREFVEVLRASQNGTVPDYVDGSSSL